MTQARHDRFVETATGFSPRLGRAMRALGPLDLPRVYTDDDNIGYFLCRAVIGQQLSVKAARTIWGRIEDAALDEDETIPAFFTADRFDLLRRCGASNAKARTLLAIAGAAADGLLDAGLLHGMEPHERMTHLQQIKGVGPWTADMAAIFFFNDPDIWPEGDASARKALERYAADAGMSAAEAAALFAPDRSLLALYLWRITDTEL